MTAPLPTDRRASPLACYLLIWAAAFALLLRERAFRPVEALTVFAILGLLFPALVLLATRRDRPLPQSVRRPLLEAALLTAYLAVIALVLVFGFARVAAVKTEPLHSLALLALKLATFVALPALLLRGAGRYRLRELAPLSLRVRDLRPALWLSVAVILFQAVFGRGLRDLMHSGLPWHTLLLGVPLAYAWLTLEAGVVEEFFFRALLQTRLAAALRSEWAALVGASLLFGVVHAPGLYLRTGATMEMIGPHPSLLMAVGYSIVVTSLAGAFLGVLWLRTHNFAVVVLVHAAGDLVQGILPFVTAFHLTR